MGSYITGSRERTKVIEAQKIAYPCVSLIGWFSLAAER